jgi:type I restriction enzyme S subunit
VTDPETQKFRRLASLITEKSSGEAFKLALEHVNGWVGSLTADPGEIESTQEEVAGDGIRFMPGDVLFGKLRPYLAKAWVADRHGSAIGDFHVYRPSRTVHPKFLFYSIVRREYIDEVNASTYGSKMPRANWDFISNTLHYVPTIGEQRRIAEFLDRETAQIDSLIAKQQQLISTLAERQDSRWAELFAALERAGGLTQVRRMIRSIVDGPFGSSLTSAHYVDEGHRVVRLGNLGLWSFKDLDRAFIDPDYAAELSAHAVLPGDVLVAGLGDEKMPLGRACVAPQELGPAIVKADCYRVRLARGVDPHFFAWALSAPQTRDQFQLLSRGSTRSRLNTTVVRDARIPLPDESVQREIVADFLNEIARTEKLVSSASQARTLLAERRQALISAAVTGKIYVGAGS